MEKLIAEFNLFFSGSAEIVRVGNEIKISVGAKTLIVSLPSIIGADSMGR